MTNPILENIRQSLNRSKTVDAHPFPALPAGRQAGSAPEEMALFLREVEKLSGTTGQFPVADLSSALSSLVQTEKIHKATLWGTPWLKQLHLAELLASLGVEIIPPGSGKYALVECDLGITEADYLLPETGTLVLRSSAEKPRAVSLLPRLHLAIVRHSMLRADLAQVFAEAQGSPYLLFITGPSRTADIEMTVTLGVHGPKALSVWSILN